METETHIDNIARSTRIFHWTIASIGGALFLYSLAHLPYSELGLNFVFISVLTVAIGSRVAIDFQQFKSNISVADVFIYLVAILYGGETATCLVAVEAYITSSRFTRRSEFRAFNAGILATSIFVSYQISYFAFGPLSDVVKRGITPQLLGAAALMIIVHYLINTSMVATSTAFRTGRPVLETWRKYYVWMLIPFVASGSVAIVAASSVQVSGFYAFLIILPIIGIIYFGYHSQQGKMQAVTDQASQAKRHLVEITESETRFRSAFSNAPIGIALMSHDGVWLQANDSICGIFDCTEEEFISRPLQDIIHPEDLMPTLKQIGYLLQGKKPSFQAELRLQKEDGQELWTQTSISLLSDSESSNLICQIQDITARRIAEDKLRHDAFYDELTKLANRRLLMERLETVIDNAVEGRNAGFTAIFLDLDRFKLINDSIGHEVGDKLLKAVAKRLRGCLPADSTFARLGSDEFFVLIEHGEDETLIIGDLVRELQSQVALEFNVLGHSINITASMGVVFYDKSHRAGADVLRDAGTALHMAKGRGRANYVLFDEKMRARANGQMQLEKDLQKAVRCDELFVVYQPILSLDDSILAGFEALVRWQHPTFGIVSPLDFIPLAEENGTIIEIGSFVLSEACRQIDRWQRELGRELELAVSVNVSTKQLLQKNLFANVVDALEKHKIKPSQIKLEITESVVVENNDFVLSILRQFRSLGVKLSMDDFGTGYSSLSYLHNLPIDTLKIDRSFISQMSDDPEGAEIVRTILLLAKNLGLDVIAEGIETQTQCNILQELACEYGQGYHFSQPLSADDARDFIDRSHVSVSAMDLGVLDFRPPHFDL